MALMGRPYDFIMKIKKPGRYKYIPVRLADFPAFVCLKR
jgi:hypothetical protein